MVFWNDARMAEHPVPANASHGWCRCRLANRHGRTANVLCGPLVVLIGAILLGGCKGGASITVDATVPSPLVDPIRASMGVYFDDALVNYVHEEELEEYGAYRLDIGASQAPVFARVFNAMFQDVVRVQPVPAGDDETTEADEPDEAIRFVGTDGSPPVIAGIIAPSIEEVQFATPAQTGGDFYEVWILYKLTLFDAGGQSVGEYPLIGYGKANERNFGQLGQQTPALHEATIWALRDAAAVLALQFRDQAAVQNWLASIGVEPTN